jgi:ATP phosphoribosyltransferase regulatory subunit HisZ
MLIKLADFDDQLADELKNIFGEKTASGAVRRAAIIYPDLLRSNAQLLDKCCVMRNEIERLNNILENARASAAALLDKTSQTDIFAGDA